MTSSSLSFGNLPSQACVSTPCPLTNSNVGVARTPSALSAVRRTSVIGTPKRLQIVATIGNGAGQDGDEVGVSLGGLIFDKALIERRTVCAEVAAGAQHQQQG